MIAVIVLAAWIAIMLYGSWYCDHLQENHDADIDELLRRDREKAKKRRR